MMLPNRITPENKDIVKYLLKAAFEQHWLHARHVENERLAITAGYVTLTGALLTYLKGTKIDYDVVPLLLFMFAVSLFGLGMCMKLHAIFAAHSASADQILTDNDLHSMQRLLRNHPLDRYKWLRVSGLFASLYVAGAAFSVYLVGIALGAHWQAATTAALLIFALTLCWVTSREYKHGED